LLTCFTLHNPYFQIKMAEVFAGILMICILLYSWFSWVDASGKLAHYVTSVSIHHASVIMLDISCEKLRIAVPVCKYWLKFLDKHCVIHEIYFNLLHRHYFVNLLCFVMKTFLYPYYFYLWNRHAPTYRMLNELR